MKEYLVGYPLRDIPAAAEVEVLESYPLELTEEQLARMSDLKRRMIRPTARKIRLKRRKTLDHWAHAAGDVVSEPVAEVLRRFDLGPVRLQPMEVENRDRERLPAHWYHFRNRIDLEASAEWRPGVVVAQSPGVAGPNDPSGPLQSLDLFDGALAVDVRGDTPDLWFDRRNLQLLFISRDLFDALQAGKLCGKVRFFRCGPADMPEEGGAGRLADARQSARGARGGETGGIRRLLQFVGFGKTSGKS